MLGENGVGKTTTLRILPLFFGHLPSQIVASGHGQEPMIRFVIPTDASAIAFEYQRGSNREEDRRLRHTACLLSDIGWRVHPDHRGEQTLSLVVNGNFGAITHTERAFVGLSVFYRYAGLSEENQPPVTMQELLTPAQLERARLLGAAFRVAHLISAARPGVLPATHFRSQGRKLMLVFEHRLVDLVADRVGSRFKQLARLVSRAGSIVRR